MEYTEKKATKLKTTLGSATNLSTNPVGEIQSTSNFDLSRWRDAFWGCIPRQFHEDPQKYILVSYDVIFLVSYDVMCFFHIFIVKRYKKSSTLFVGWKSINFKHGMWKPCAKTALALESDAGCLQHGAEIAVIFNQAVAGWSQPKI